METEVRKMAQAQIYEGTAEEIAMQLRSSNLAGRLKAIVTSDELLAKRQHAEFGRHALPIFLRR